MYTARDAYDCKYGNPTAECIPLGLLVPSQIVINSEPKMANFIIPKESKSIQDGGFFFPQYIPFSTLNVNLFCIQPQNFLIPNKKQKNLHRSLEVAPEN